MRLDELLEQNEELLSEESPKQAFQKHMKRNNMRDMADMTNPVSEWYEQNTGKIKQKGFDEKEIKKAISEFEKSREKFKSGIKEIQNVMYNNNDKNFVKEELKKEADRFKEVIKKHKEYVKKFRSKLAAYRPEKPSKPSKPEKPSRPKLSSDEKFDIKNQKYKEKQLAKAKERAAKADEWKNKVKSFSAAKG